MKKVMVYAYTKFNLGDDLFLKILFERYPKTKFILFTPKKYKEIFTNKNVRFISSDGIVFRGINFILRRINRKITINKIISNACDASVYIGGSIFQQLKNWPSHIDNRRKLLNKNQPFYVLGANFGPFSDKEYYLEYKKLFAGYEDICFRDTYSYNLFKDFQNVRIADDIVFSLKHDSTPEPKNNIVVSVIKPSYRPYLKEYDNIYYKKIRDICIEFINKGYNVTLMSFCKLEGDEEAIEGILKIIPDRYLQYVTQHKYRGDIEGSLEVIFNSNVVVASRFHAMILGWLFEKPVFPIVYSKKMTNVIKDVGFSGLYTDFNNIDQLNALEVYKNIENTIVDVNKQKESSEKHFKMLDYLLKDKI